MKKIYKNDDEKFDEKILKFFQKYEKFLTELKNNLKEDSTTGENYITRAQILQFQENHLDVDLQDQGQKPKSSNFCNHSGCHVWLIFHLISINNSNLCVSSRGVDGDYSYAYNHASASASTSASASDFTNSNKSSSINLLQKYMIYMCILHVNQLANIDFHFMWFCC